MATQQHQPPQQQSPPQQPPWEEALDLDDSDISSSFSLLRRCSTRHPSPPHQPPSLRQIPGPAATIQAAMHRKVLRNCHNGNEQRELSEVSTQEFIRRVEEDSTEEFSRDPWLFAIDHLRHHHGVFGSTTSLRDVKKCVNAQRFDQVVAIVKSCTPNGLGDLIISLKDPTDTIGASVHRKVLTAEDFGRLVTVGSVLILKKVVVFSSLCASSYLNITRRNLATVISEDCKVHNYPEVNAGNTQVISRYLEVPERITAIVSGLPEQNFEDVQQSYHLKRKAEIEKLMGKENSTQANRLFGSRQTQNVDNELPDERVHINRANSGSDWLPDNLCTQTQPGYSRVQGTARILVDLRNVENLCQVTDLSSAPGNSENLGYEDTSHRIGAEMNRLFRAKNTASLTDKPKTQVHGRTDRSSSMPETVNDPDTTDADDVLKQRHHRGFSTAPSVMGNPVSADGSETDDCRKRIQETGTTNQDDHDTFGANGCKKQRLISATSLQEWTDEQLSILDMDED